ncbi:MAG: hypothetical protein K8R92_08585 [Planctomycetes bacterium]|nr:hypothetical protein [Planctomycetota bacterium]
MRSPTCHVLFAFEAAFAIDLALAEKVLAAGAGGEPSGGLLSGGRNLTGADFHPRPVRSVVRLDPVVVAAWHTAAECRVTIYDFGAISVCLEIPLHGPLEALLPLARALTGNPQLTEAARKVALQVLERIAAAVTKPRLAPHVEDYVIYAIPAPADAGSALSIDREFVARLLRAEESRLSEEETADAFSHTVRYAPNDLAVVDWNAALLMDDDPGASIAVLEFANTELLEMRHLDDELDASLAEAYGLSAKHLNRRRLFAGRTARDASRLAEMQIDAATIFEAVNNALKLYGDQYLARLHSAATRRFHTEDYERSVLRKVETLESIYGKIRDAQSQLRMEILEWIIIALIAFEVGMSLLR